MIGSKSSSQIRPVALGASVSSSTYGKAINIIYGMTRVPLDLIWSANIRKGGSKFKTFLTFGKDTQNYIENVDFLIGHNPISGVLQAWQNQNTRLPLNFVKYTAGVSGGILGDTVTIPDPEFYWVIGVTLNANYSLVVHDYGGPASRTLTGSFEIPLWNIANASSNPTDPPELRFNPNTFYWTPDMGPTVRFPMVGGTVNIYYAELNPDGSSLYSKKGSGTAVPVAALSMTFESELGTGPEYSGNDNNTGQPLSDQQLFYPPYAGVGAPQFNLGAVGMLPQTWFEVLGSFPVEPTGDADFCDMVEDIVSSGLTQAAFNSAAVYGSVQRGVGCFDYPGVVQCFLNGTVEAWFPELFYPRGNVAGNILVVAFALGTTGTPTIASSLGDTWTPIFSGSVPGQLWTAPAVGGRDNVITLTGQTNSNEEVAIEVGGVDTLDSEDHASGNGTVRLTVSVTTTQAPGVPVFLLVWANYTLETIAGNPTPKVPGWDNLVGHPESENFLVYKRTVYSPRVYTFTLNAISGAYPLQLAILALKTADPPKYSAALGNIIDKPSLELCRQQDRAYGLYGSLLMDSQQSASDWLETIYKAMNAWPVYIGFKLHSLPLAEASFAGGGGLYTAPTASGPIVPLTESDFIGEGNGPLIKVRNKSQFDIPSLLQIQHPNRTSEYNDVATSQPEASHTALFGTKKDSPKQMRCIQDTAVARRVLGVMIREQNLPTYLFKLQGGRNSLLTPGDLTSVPASAFLETVAGVPATTAAVPIRFTKVVEDAQYGMDCEAEPYIFGLRTPIALGVTYPTPGGQPSGTNAGPVNEPIIFEPVPRLAGQPTQGQIWIAVSGKGAGQILTVAVGTSGGTGYQIGDVLTVVQSGASGGTIAVSSIDGSGSALTFAKATLGTGYKQGANLATTGGHGTGAVVNITTTGSYGGCLVYVSTDSGTSYNQIGDPLTGSAITGVATADWPAAADPDITNDLSINLSESNGALATYPVSDEDSFTQICYIESGNTCVPYELMTYATPILMGPNQYTLLATGVGNHLRRAVFGAPNVGVGVDHPINSRFAFLGPTGQLVQPGIAKLPMDPTWIGKTLFFKFPSFNALAGGVQSLADCTAYQFTPTGCPFGRGIQNTEYVNIPYLALSNPAPDLISLVPVETQFPTNTVEYAARTFTIPVPTAPTVYYITIADPGYTGDLGGVATLSAFAETTNAKVGVPGYTYMGFIQVFPAGGSTVVGSGGWPPPLVITAG